MNRWIKRSFVTVALTTVVVGALSGCGASGRHSRHWSDEQISEARGKAIERIGSKLELNNDQKGKLAVLADELIASRKALRGDTDPRGAVSALFAGEKFDRIKAQQWLDSKLQVAQGNSPKLLTSLAEFYDSLSPTQQGQVREFLEKRRHSGRWGRG